jgi:hypothetical protein
MALAQIIIRAVRRIPALTLTVLLAASGAVQAADATDRVARTLALPPSRAIRVEATIADVTIVGSSRADVAVEIVRRAPHAADLARYPVHVDETSGTLRIGAVQADDGRDATLKTAIVVEAPASAIVQAVRVFEGHVKLSSLTAACDVDIRRGAIEASGLGGRIRLESGIGSIEVTRPALVAGGMMRLRVFNGPIRVGFARPPDNARILAVTLNGTIRSEIPLAMKDQFGPRFGETTIGTGEPVVSIDVVKGDIEIRVLGVR